MTTQTVDPNIDQAPSRFVLIFTYHLIPLILLLCGGDLNCWQALNSIWTLIPIVVALVIAVIRTALEDKTLHEELPGYRGYARRVHYRLFPGIY